MVDAFDSLGNITCNLRDLVLYLVHCAFLCLFTFLLQLMRFCFDYLFENIVLCRLRIAIIHHFIEQFIDDNEVIFDGFLFEFLEVVH